MSAEEHVLRAAPEGERVAVDVTPESAGWGYCGLQVWRLAPGESASLETGTSEAMVLSLSGGARVRVVGEGDRGAGGFDEEYPLVGRESVFRGASDVVYAPRGSTLTVTSTDADARIAVCTAECERRLEPAYLPAGSVPVELRGAGQSSRQVHNFGVPGVLDADRMIACEVLTPGGNWSSWPPHKHDEERDGETRLEEIYYFEVGGGVGAGAGAGGGVGAGVGVGSQGIGYQRVYGHEGAEIDVCTEVRTGDVVLVPHGWHGPSIAAPGYDLYYLNVMAGPGSERAWLICDDPDHTWVRDTWADLPIDPRLPFGGG